MKIFVYGSLKKNKKLHNFLKNATFTGYATTCSAYPMILSKSGWYPYLLNIKNEGKKVHGEVYDVDYNILKRLDRLEEIPHYYVRRKICVKIGYKTFLVWCYFSKKKRKFLKKDLTEVF